MKKEKKEKLLEEALSKAFSPENKSTLPLFNSEIDNIKKGDIVYSASFSVDENGKEEAKVLEFQFQGWVKNSINTEEVRMGNLVAIENGKPINGVKIPPQNMRVGYFLSKKEALTAFKDKLDHISQVIKEAADKAEN